MLASFALLDALVSDAPVGLGFWDTELRYQRLNDFMARMAGVPAADHIGRTLPEMLGAFGVRLEERVREALESGESVSDVAFSGRLPGAPGGARHWRFSFYPVGAPNRTVLGVGATAVDVTAEHEAAERQRRAARQERRLHARTEAMRAEVLARASSALSSTLEPEAVLDALAQAVVPELADWCTIHTVEPRGGLRLVAVAHRDPERREHARELAERYPPSAEATLPAMRELGSGSAVVLPLRSRRRVLGALTLVMDESARRYTGDTLELAESVAAQAAVALENAQLYAEQARVAHALQESLLPPALPHVPGVELAARYRPAGRASEVGGDFYDIFSYEPGLWRFVIGDVVGKGPEAAALTAVVRYILHGAEMSEVPLAAKLHRVNDALMRRSPSVEFCSAVYGCFEPAGDDLVVRYVLCGHPPPLVLRADGAIEPLEGGGPLLGVAARPRYDEHEVRLAPGDRLLLYTDGVIELPGPDPWRGEALFHAAVREAAGATSAELVGHVEAATLRAAGGTPRDDIALLAIGLPPRA